MWDAETDGYNIPYVKKLLPGCPVVRIRVASRSQGFYVASGNPKQISSWEDLRRRDPRVQQMIRILQSRDFQEQFAFMKGYDVSEMGTVML